MSQLVQSQLVQTTTEQTYYIPASNLEIMLQRIMQLNRKSHKLGCDPIKVYYEADHERIGIPMSSKDRSQHWIHWLGKDETSDNDCGIRMTWYKVRLVGTVPSYNGWDFIATLSPITMPDGTQQNQVRAIPGIECPEYVRNKVSVCDHCKTNRRRKDTYVVRNRETGEIKTVGRQCLKDFLGTNDDPHHLASQAEMLIEYPQICEEYSSPLRTKTEEIQYELVHVLAITHEVIKREGWCSKRMASETGRISTADSVLLIIAKGSEVYRITEESMSVAKEAINWVNKCFIGSNDYERNCLQLAKAGKVRYKDFGTACSILPGYIKEQQKLVEHAKGVLYVDEYLGEVGSKIENVPVTIVKITTYPNQSIYNNSEFGHCIKCVSERGHRIVWFGYGIPEVAENDKWTIVKATIKKHQEYKGTKETIVNRVKLA